MNYITQWSNQEHHENENNEQKLQIYWAKKSKLWENCSAAVV